MSHETNAQDEAKREWVRPEAREMNAGSAESGFSGVNDGSGQQQS